MTHRHALIFGGSGISGWAVTQAALKGDTFSRITCVASRQTTLQDGLFPPDPRLVVIHHVDLALGAERVIAFLGGHVPDVHTVTHVFLLAYTARRPDYAAEEKANVYATQVAIEAATSLSDSVQHITQQTGGKWYGLHIADECGRPAAPIREDTPRLAPPHAGKVFYYAQYDAVYALWAAQRHRENAWNFTELRPNAIVGFNQHPSPMNIAAGWAMYLSVQHELRGAGARVAWPGTWGTWRALATDASQDMLGAAHVWFALDAEGAAARAGTPNANSFNVADHGGAPMSWEGKWPALCAYFGLVGAPPREGETEEGDVEAFMAEHDDAWARLCEKHGLRSRGWLREYSYPVLAWATHGLDFDSSLDVARAREAGFAESFDTVEGYRVAFDRMVQARLIPAFMETREIVG